MQIFGNARFAAWKLTFLFGVLIALGCGKVEQPQVAHNDDTTSTNSISPAKTDPSDAQGVSGSNHKADEGRNIEPTFSGPGPFFCRIAIGPNREKLIMTAADVQDQVVYVDLNSNGSLSDEGERFEAESSSKYENTTYFSITIPEIAQGDDIHTDFKIKYGYTVNPNDDSDPVEENVKAVFSMKLWGWDAATTDADLVTLNLPCGNLAANETPLVHFNGPLTMGNYRKVVEMPRGEEVKFYSLAGTAGESGGTLAAVSNTSIADDAHPKAEFEFPHRDAGKPAIKVKTYLTTRC